MLHCLSSLATLGVATDQRPQSLCPAGCNGHGFCDDSTCVCHPGCAGPAAHDPAARCLPLSPSHTAHRRRSRAQVLRRRLLCAGRRGRRGLAATLGARAAAARSARGLSGSRATRRLCTALPAQYMRHFQRRRMLAGRSDGLRVRWLLRHTALAAAAAAAAIASTAAAAAARLLPARVQARHVRGLRRRGVFAPRADAMLLLWLLPHACALLAAAASARLDECERGRGRRWRQQQERGRAGGGVEALCRDGRRSQSGSAGRRRCRRSGGRCGHRPGGTDRGGRGGRKAGGAAAAAGTRPGRQHCGRSRRLLRPLRAKLPAELLARLPRARARAV